MEHRQQLKNSMYEGSARVPLIISGPGYRANQVVTNLTSLLDLYPTFADIVGAPKLLGKPKMDLNPRMLVR